MNTKTFSVFVVIAGLLAIALVIAAFQPAAANPVLVTIIAYPAESIGQTRSVARVYAEPDDSSTILQVLSPGKQIQILGLSENGAWIAMAKDDQVSLAGWLSIGEVNQSLMVGTTRSLAKAYQQPDAASPVAATLPPAAKLQILGHNPDNTWIAIAHTSQSQRLISWVNASDVKMPDMLGNTTSVTRLYLRPDSSSQMMSVLSPGQKVLLIGRNDAGTWFAVADASGNKFIGWAQVGDLKISGDRSTLRVLPVH